MQCGIDFPDNKMSRSRSESPVWLEICRQKEMLGWSVRQQWRRLSSERPRPVEKCKEHSKLAVKLYKVPQLSPRILQNMKTWIHQQWLWEDAVRLSSDSPRKIAKEDQCGDFQIFGHWGHWVLRLAGPNCSRRPCKKSNIVHYCGDSLTDICETRAVMCCRPNLDILMIELLRPILDLYRRNGLPTGNMVRQKGQSTSTTWQVSPTNITIQLL